jgi:hypothetical protein
VAVRMRVPVETEAKESQNPWLICFENHPGAWRHNLIVQIMVAISAKVLHQLIKIEIEDIIFENLTKRLW